MSRVLVGLAIQLVLTRYKQFLRKQNLILSKYLDYFTQLSCAGVNLTGSRFLDSRKVKRFGVGLIKTLTLIPTL